MNKIDSASEDEEFEWNIKYSYQFSIITHLIENNINQTWL